MKMFTKKSFTMVELIIVSVLVGVMATFAITNYQRSITRARAKEAVKNLYLMYSANQAFEARTGSYWPAWLNHNCADFPVCNVDEINSTLNLNLNGAGVRYLAGGIGGIAYAFGAERPPNDGSSFRLIIDSEQPINEGVNPWCVSGANCPF